MNDPNPDYDISPTVEFLNEGKAEPSFFEDYLMLYYLGIGILTTFVVAAIATFIISAIATGGATAIVPALFGVSVGQINLLMDTLFASLLVAGSMSWLYYSDRLMEFPLGIFGVAIATVILPHLSRHHATESTAHFSQTVDWALRAVMLVSVPAAVMLAVMSGSMISTLFQHGRFNGHDVLMARKSLTAFAIGIAPFMLVKVLAAGFYAKHDMRTPVKIDVVAMVNNTLLNAALI